MSDDQIRMEYGQRFIEGAQNVRMTRRQLLARASVLGLSLAASGSLLAACGEGGDPAASPSATGAPAPVKGGSLIGVIPPSLTDLDPVAMRDQGSIVLIMQLCEYLVDLDDTNALVPRLAESWTSSDDASVWTFHLRQGVSFTNGRPFEAADVVATFERLTDPESGSSALSVLTGVLSPGGSEAIDTHTVRFTLERPYVDFPYLICTSNYNAVMLPRDYAGDFVKSPVGTGPFVLKEYSAGQKCTMVRNPTYWGKDTAGSQLPYLDQITWMMVQDGSAANLQLQSGAVDFQPQVAFEDSQALLDDPNLRVDVYPSSGIREVAFNVTSHLWKDKRLRQAVACCLDREAINEVLYDGRSKIGYDTFWEPTVFAGSPPSLPRTQNYDRAKALLADAGRSTLDVKLTVADYLENLQLARLIRDQCRPAGVNIVIELMSYDTFYAGSGDGRDGASPWLDTELCIVEWGGRPTPGVYAQAMLLPTSTWSSSHWHDAEFVRTFGEYMATADAAERSELAAKLSAIQRDEAPILVAFYVSQLRAQQKNVYGIQGPGSFYCVMRESYRTA
ncbi:MAG: ABC transporter substrate-binding protein [Thermoleophilia bacterium]